MKFGILSRYDSMAETCEDPKGMGKIPLSASEGLRNRSHTLFEALYDELTGSYVVFCRTAEH